MTLFFCRYSSLLKFHMSFIVDSDSRCLLEYRLRTMSNWLIDVCVLFPKGSGYKYTHKVDHFEVPCQTWGDFDYAA